jgi:hypothetical protein
MGQTGQIGLTFQSFYTRSIFSFIIPEMFGVQDSVRKPFRIKRLVDRLRNGLPIEQTLTDFSKADPIFNFAEEVGPNDYRDEFWAPYWNVLQYPGPPHFPFEMKYRRQLSRAVDWTQLRSVSKGDLIAYHNELRCRLFPYGALSFHFIESFDFKKGCSPEDMVSLLEQPMTCEGRIVKQGQFINETRANIIDQVVERVENSQFTKCAPQNILIHPDVDVLPDLNTSWKDVAMLLALSNVPRLVEKHDQELYPNYGRKDQLILFGRYASVLLTPDLQGKENSLECLRERTANLAELVAIQQQFTKVYKDRYDRTMIDLQSRKGRPFAELVAFLNKRMSREEFLSLRIILEFEKVLVKPRWQKWASILRSSNLEAFQQFKETLDKWNEVDVDLGKDVRESVNSVLDTLQKITSIVPRGTGG